MLSLVFSLLYFLISIQKIATQFLNLYKISPDYLAAHTFMHDSVEYIFCEYRVTWDEARMMCLSYKAELATMDSDQRARAAIRTIVDSDLPVFQSTGGGVFQGISENLWIGAREDSADSWYWISNGNKITLETSPHRNVSLWYPYSADEDLQCLSLGRVHHDAPIFVPLRCNQRRSFICQKDKSKSNDESVKIMGSTRINKEEFILYSARLTWPDAVIHCRREGLQIAEVKTTVQAESLAFLMIRARPESIENAWIGGYATGNTWKWLPSGSSITNNDLWRGDNRKLHGCLLLDVCELPVYLETKCDRKRDVLCQRPLKKQISEKPIPVYIEECSYWIGFHALNWFQARVSCNELNASLVILDSSRIISHMMFLMEDNQEELRHIWTDGRRKMLRTTFSNTTLRRWTWESTGEPVPEIGASFVPLCSGGQCHDNGANCLNLDRTGYETPFVYGLACDQSQTYVCQPWSGACVTRKSDLNTNYADDDDLPQTFLPSETTIVPYYDERINRKFFHTITPINTNHNFSLKPKSQSNSFQKKINFEEGISANFSGRNNDYNTRKDFEKNAHGEFKLKSSPSDNIVPLTSNDKILNRSEFRYLPISVFDARSRLYDKIKVYPLVLRPLYYFLPNRYYYYPRYNLQSDRKKIFLYRDKNRNNYNIKRLD